MIKKIIVLAACVFAGSVAAKQKMLPMPAEAAADLQGKTLVVTRHKMPSHTAMTAGKAGFGLLGAGMMIAEGNKIIRENEVPDPAAMLEAQLAPAFAKHYGMQIKPASTPVIDVEKPQKIAATQTGTDYIFDIRSGGWLSSYYPTQWAKYWILYSVQIQLINAKDGALVANMSCTASTNKHPNSPSREQMLADKAQLFKNVSASHGWNCMKLLAAQQFHLPENSLAATPAEYIDPLKLYAEGKSSGDLTQNAPVPAASTDGESPSAVAETGQPEAESEATIEAKVETEVATPAEAGKK